MVRSVLHHLRRCRCHCYSERTTNVMLLANMFVRFSKAKLNLQLDTFGLSAPNGRCLWLFVRVFKLSCCLRCHKRVVLLDQSIPTFITRLVVEEINGD